MAEEVNIFGLRCGPNTYAPRISLAESEKTVGYQKNCKRTEVRRGLYRFPLPLLSWIKCASYFELCFKNKTKQNPSFRINT